MVIGMPEPQTFDEAISLFQDFLRKNGYSPNLVWIEPADVLIPLRREIYVKLPVSRNSVDRGTEVKNWLRWQFLKLRYRRFTGLSRILFE